MKKSIVCLLLFCLWIGTSHSQMPQVTVTWGPEQKGSSGKQKEQSYFIGNDEYGGTYSLKEKYKYAYGQVTSVKRYIEHYDKDGKLLVSEKIKIKHTGGDRFFDGVFFNEGKMYLVTYHLRRADKMNVLSVQDIDPQTLLVNKNIRALAEVPYERGIIGFVNTYALRVLNNKIYVIHTAPEKETGKTLLSIHVFDKDFNLQWKHFETLEYQKKLLEAEDFAVDENGTVRVIATVYKDIKRKVRQGKPNYEYHFFVVFDKGKDFREHTVSLGDKFITDMRFAYRPNGDIACAGFYSDKRSVMNVFTIAGAFYILIEPESTNIKLENYKEFDKEFLAHFMREAAAERGKELQNINLRSLDFLEDGSAILIAEEFLEYKTGFSITTITYEYHSTYYIKTMTTTTSLWMMYEYDNILALRINTDGEIEWAKVIPKKQHTAVDGGSYSSFVQVYVGDKIYLIYNDNPKNLTAAPGKVHGFRKNKDAVVVCVEIDKDGNIDRKALFSARDTEILTCPSSCRQISENQLKIYGEKRNTYKWGLLEFH